MLDPISFQEAGGRMLLSLTLRKVNQSVAKIVSDHALFAA